MDPRQKLVIIGVMALLLISFIFPPYMRWEHYKTRITNRLIVTSAGYHLLHLPSPKIITIDYGEPTHWIEYSIDYRWLIAQSSLLIIFAAGGCLILQRRRH